MNKEHIPSSSCSAIVVINVTLFIVTLPNSYPNEVHLVSSILLHHPDQKSGRIYCTMHIS